MRLLLLPLFFLSPVWAENPLKIGLVPEVRAIAAGKTFWVGLHLEHPDGMHTYWKHPGIVGLATSVTWDLPLGFQAGAIQWPAPQMVKMGVHDAQGYEGETLLMVPLTPPSELGESPVTLTARVSWMCCGNQCHPAVDVPVSVVLPVSSEAKVDPAARAIFGKFRALVPQRDPAWQTAVVRDEGGVVLTLKPPADLAAAQFVRFFTGDGQVDSRGNQPVEVQADGRLRIRLSSADSAPPDAKSLPGVVELQTAAGAPAWLEIDPKY